VLDAVAIAGQVIVGRSLGAGAAGTAREAGRRMIGWSVVAGTGFGLLLAALVGVLPDAFTNDADVIERAEAVWPLFVLMQPVAGAVFALDGILIGAGDPRYLMWSMAIAALGVYAPIALASLAFDWGLVGVWCGLCALMAARLATLGVRFAGRAWAVTGAPS
jgi:Na+-driven multidrug efflux pump